ncbi:competence/damage-inducible protein CinA-like protein [Mycolicibacterium phlei]|uniref:Competence protein n=1 Tax=Mycolicibacterium phlei DSM 43239 = CCUG 21000 TaxID=1226750 RepID=A0A5N5VDJ1_MYCPH|nr:CinA family protein [Mycolicibacterium phlei]VEG10064.1 competence/damage-inducible protein CinA-like protein [Mycobacteroides chelonae]AMO61959.1 Putative competence-damage inducible protein [Mycolicibacterium phlei]EID15612.1 CinA domain-containing protein [Mycolicibacterium phlei RIVM601174]KAB7758529.1 competence protein [Mycolicibacterium phlei DSM 43239 = CCUG 21000]KXW67029.1 competence protein [Mycolicibacterium phlei DSM 43239 = CCUG 21000]
MPGSPTDDPLVNDDARAVVADLTVRGQTVATAESLTAGLLAATLAGVPGASAVLLGGLVTYTVDTKVALAGVPREVLAEVGPVAEPTARALAVGAQQRCGATWGVGLTGVAGPEPHGGHPVGTVFLGIAGPLQTSVVELALTGSRWQIRLAAVREALVGLRAAIAQH